MRRFIAISCSLFFVLTSPLHAALLSFEFSGNISGFILTPNNITFDDFVVGDAVDFTVEYDTNTPVDSFGGFLGAINAASLVIEEGQPDEFNETLSFNQGNMNVFNSGSVDTFGATIFDLIGAPVVDGLFLNSISVVIQDLDGATLTSAGLPTSVNPLNALLNAVNGQSFFSLNFNNGGSLPTEFATIQVALSTITDVTDTGQNPDPGPDPTAASAPSTVALFIIGLFCAGLVRLRESSVKS